MIARHQSAFVRRNATIATCAVATFLTGCGGSNGTLPVAQRPASVATPAGGNSAAGTPGSSATAGTAIVQSFTITVPAASSANALHRPGPQYVSMHTQSVRIAVQSVDGAASSIAATIASTTSGAPGCAATGAGLQCTIAVTAAAGDDVFAIATYASPGATGTPLATTTVAATVTGAAAAPIALSLGGVAAAIAFSPAVLPLVNDGAIHRYAVTLDAVDASGATIVGSSAYASDIALAIVADPTHALSLSTASVTIPGTVVTVTFDGSKSLADASITATATAATTATLAAAPITLAPASLFAYDDQTGGTTTTVSQAGFKGTFGATLAAPSDGSVAVTTGPLGTGSASVSVIPAITFDVTTLAVSNGTYSATIPVTIAPQPSPYTAFGAEHVLGMPYGLVRASSGMLWTADMLDGSVVSFDPTSGTYAAYVVDPSDAGPTSVAFDTTGKLWFADGTQIGSFDTTTHAIATYSAGLYSDSRVLSIATGPAGTMWFYDLRENRPPLDVGMPTAFGTIATASGTISEFATPDDAYPALAYESMTLGPDGALWFADGGAGAIGRITTAGAYTTYAAAGPNSPNFETDVVSNAPDGNIWFAGTNQGLGQGFVGDVNIATKTTALYSQGVESGEFDALIAGSDNNLWFAERPGVDDFFSPQDAIGVINITTHASYPYPALVPQFGVVAGLVDPGNRTLYMLDTAFGQIGKVPFK